MPRLDLTRAEFLTLLGGTGVSALAAGMPIANAAPIPALPLLTRPIPKTGEALPVIGLGTWLVFDVGLTQSEMAPRREVVKLMIDGGGSVIDSSPMYGNAEAVTGELVHDLGARKKAFFATKVWTSGRNSGIRQMDQSFRRMRTEVMDLMQIHNLVDWRTHLKTLRKMKESGKIRYIGITHYTSSALDDLADVIEKEPVDFVQMAYSVGERDAEERLLPLAAEKGVAVLVNRPYEGGDLFGATRGRPLPAWAAEFDCRSWGQFFLKYILAHPAVTCVIPGTGKPAHMLDNLQAGRGRLPDAAHKSKMLTLIKEL
ncbi:MAG: aldo/keto reductase [Rhodospirillales bacterium]